MPHSSTYTRYFSGILALRFRNSSRSFSGFSEKDVLYTLKKLRVQKIAGENILFPVTLEQRRIYNAFSIKPPVLS
jgi:hypothetical protein